MVEGAVDFSEEDFEVEGVVALVGDGLADRTDESFAFAGRVDADEGEELSFVEVALRTLEVSHSHLLDCFRLDIHKRFNKYRPISHYSNR